MDFVIIQNFNIHIKSIHVYIVYVQSMYCIFIYNEYIYTGFYICIHTYVSIGYRLQSTFFPHPYYFICSLQKSWNTDGLFGGKHIAAQSGSLAHEGVSGSMCWSCHWKSRLVVPSTLCYCLTSFVPGLLSLDSSALWGDQVGVSYSFLLIWDSSGSS